MSFVKAFGFSLIAFIGLNIVFFLIGYGIQGLLGSYFAAVASSPSLITLMILGPIASSQFPALLISQVTAWVMGFPIVFADVFLFIGFIVSPLVAAILSGRFGEKKTEAFGGWFTTVMIISLIVMIWTAIEISLLSVPAEIIIAQILLIIGLGLTYGFGYGCISLLIAKEY